MRRRKYEKKSLKQSTINKILGGISLLLTFLTIFFSLLTLNSFSNVRESETTKSEYKQLGNDLVIASDYLTNEARKYVQFGKKVHYDNYWKEVNQTKTSEKILSKLKELGLTEEELNLIEDSNNKSNELVKLEEAAMKAVEQGDLEQARHLMFDDEYEQARLEIMKPIDEFLTKMNDRVNQDLENASSQLNLYIILTIFLVVLVMASILFSIFISSKKILAPIITLKDHMIKISEGDLTQNITIEANDTEIGQLAQSIIKTNQNLKEMIASVLHASKNLNGSSGELAQKSNLTSAGISDIAATIEQIATTIQQVSDNTQKVSDLSEQVEKASENGIDKVQKVTEQMETIHQASSKASDTVISLSETLEKINQIVTLITHISDETNLLALNAAIEAARAGEQGRGFAVVAQEVRKLSEQSAQAAEDIRSLIEQVQSESHTAVDAMQEGNRQVQEGRTVVKEVDVTFQTIINSIRNLVGQIQSVAAASEEVTAAVETVASTTIEQKDAMTDVAQASRQLTDMAVDLQSQASQFKIN